jgi:predicted metal-binding membrane protein
MSAIEIPRQDDPGGRGPRWLVLFRKPQTVALVTVLVLSIFAWTALLWEAARDGLSAQALWSAVCRPVGLTGDGFSVAPGDIALALAMWTAMSLAMMLPTAAPMIVTYGDLAETAREKGRRVASPLWIVAGYSAVWIAISVVAVALQSAVVAAWAVAELPARLGLAIAGVLIGAAGLYQFSDLKHACLTACRNPFVTLFGRWTETPAGVFRLGLREGVNCLGCCWALMGILIVAGAMNVVWMALFSILMTAEKMTAGRALPYGIGLLLITAGGALGIAAAGPDNIVAWLTARP